MSEEKCCPDLSEKTENSQDKKQKRLWKYISRILWNAIFFFFINLFPLWLPKTQGVVTSDWIRVLWAMNLAVIVTIAGSLVLIYYSAPWMKAMVNFLISLTGLISSAVFLAVFPLDFSRIVGLWLNTLIRVFLIIGVVGSAIGVIASLGKFVKAVIGMNTEA